MGKNFKKNNRQVNDIYVYVMRAKRVYRVRVSTVFLGLDHSVFGGSPLLFETMIFGGPLDGEQNRCSTYEQAEAMHETMIVKLLDTLKPLYTILGFWYKDTQKPGCEVLPSGLIFHPRSNKKRQGKNHGKRTRRTSYPFSLLYGGK